MAQQQDRRGGQPNHQRDRETGEHEWDHEGRGQEEDRQDEGEQGEGDDPSPDGPGRSLLDHVCGRGCVDSGGHHARAGCGRAADSGPSTGSTVSPRVLVMRRATNAAARKKTLDASSDRWNPEVSASSTGARLASRSPVREVAIAVKIASPSAPPTCCEALSSAAASPDSPSATPAFAAVRTATNMAPSPSEVITRPGRRSARYEPSTGMRDSQYTPPEPISEPTTITGRVPRRGTSWEAMPAATPTPKVSGR